MRPDLFTAALVGIVLLGLFSGQIFRAVLSGKQYTDENGVQHTIATLSPYDLLWSAISNLIIGFGVAIGFAASNYALTKLFGGQLTPNGFVANALCGAVVAFIFSANYGRENESQPETVKDGGSA